MKLARWGIALVVLSLSLVARLEAAVVFDAVGSGTCTGTGCASSTTLTYSHTVTAAGSGRAIVVGVCMGHSGAVPSVNTVTYAGSPLAPQVKTANATNGYYCQLFSLTNPATGANNVVVTLASALNSVDKIYSISLSFTGVDSASPWVQTPTGADDGGTLGPTAALTVASSPANSLGVDFVCAGSDQSSTTETSRFEFALDNANWCWNMAAATAAAGDTAWSWTISANDAWVMVGGVLREATAAAATPPRRPLVY